MNQINTQARRSRRDTSVAELLTGHQRRRRRQLVGSQMYEYKVITRTYSMAPTSMHELSLFVRMETGSSRDLRPRLMLGGLPTDAEWLAASTRYGLYSIRENLIGCFYGVQVNVIVLSGRKLLELFEQYNRNAVFLDVCPRGTLLFSYIRYTSIFILPLYIIFLSTRNSIRFIKSTIIVSLGLHCVGAPSWNCSALRCWNFGVCVPAPRSYCDCTHTAYHGFFCDSCVLLFFR